VDQEHCASSPASAGGGGERRGAFRSGTHTHTGVKLMRQKMALSHVSVGGYPRNNQAKAARMFSLQASYTGHKCDETKMLPPSLVLPSLYICGGKVARNKEQTLWETSEKEIIPKTVRHLPPFAATRLPPLIHSLSGFRSGQHRYGGLELVQR